MPELATALLSPKLPPLPKRDPFGLAARAQRLSAKLVAKPGRGSNGHGSRANPAGKINAPVKAVDPLSGLSLSGTCIVGDQRLAVINGRLYAPKDKLIVDKPAVNRGRNNKSAADKTAADKPATEKSATEKSATEQAAERAAAYLVVDVLPYKVLLAHDGQLLELGYSNVSSGPPSAARENSKNGAGAKKSRGKSGRKT